MPDNKREPCLTCDNAIFDEQWGEYKCKYRGHRIYHPSNYEGCDGYKKKSDKK